MRLDVRLLEYEPRHAEPYLRELERNNMLSPDRDQPNKWELVAKRAGSIVVAESVDGEFVGAAQTGRGEGIPMLEGLVVAQDWQGQDVGDRLGHAIKATHQFRGATTVESLTNAPFPITLTDEQIATFPPDMQRTIRYHRSQGFKLAYGMYGWETEELDALGDLVKEQADLDYDEDPEIISQAIKSIYKAHTKPTSVVMRNQLDTDLQLSHLPEPFSTLTIPKSHSGLPIPATELYRYVTTDFDDVLDSNDNDEDMAGLNSIKHRWAIVPQASTAKSNLIVLRLLEFVRIHEPYTTPDDTRYMNLDGTYVAYDETDETYHIFNVADGEVAQASSDDIDTVKNSLTHSSWYFNLTPIQRYIYDKLPTTNYFKGEDFTRGKPLSDVSVMSVVGTLSLFYSNYTPPVDTQRREWY